ncbi:flagellar motor switch phosphatase FliY [Proteinivorax hydrogeniformans]|uniref:Flagellar motor switch phosphatase FliY n=1 Tax=Proteinivorax hydrogeniformans TaxID=1826727 RepID=A0AAU8HQ77_9FIRM
MSDVLSQEEIDALLSSNNKEEKGTIEIEAWERDAIGEIGNISLGAAATSLSSLINQKVQITTPYVELTTKQQIAEEHPKPCIIVEVNYTEGLEGVNVLVIDQKDAAIIANLMLGGDGRDINDQISEMELSAVSEAMNQMMGGSATSMSTMFGKTINISPPSTQKVDLAEQNINGALSSEDKVVKVAFRMVIGDLIDSVIMQLIPIEFFKDLIGNISPGMAESDEVLTDNDLDDKGSESPKNSEEPKKEEVDNTMSSKKEAYSSPTSVSQREQKTVDYQKVDFSDLEPQTSSNEAQNIDLIMDVPLEVTVELGRTKKKIKDILSFGAGSIIELEKMAGEDVDILANGKVIATGEVVVINENFGVRVTNIITPMERVKKLQ